MARIPLTIAAATLALAVSAPLAHAQMGSAVPPGNSMGSGGMTSGMGSGSAMQGSGSMQGGGAMGMGGQAGTQSGTMPHPMPHHGAAGSGMQRPMDSANTYGMGGMTGQSGMAGQGQSGMMGQGGMAGSTGQMAPVPTQPLAGVQLPPQQGVGNGAYNGGGVVLEHLPDGTTRIVR